MPWKPSHPGERPTLGWYVLDWITEHLAAPDRAEYEPYLPTREQAKFLLNFYELDHRTGRRRYRRGVISRPKGWGKSPFLSAIALAEALADVVPDGWDADGQPVGKPWASVRTPWVQIAAASEDQTRNSWDPLLEMLREGPVLDAYPGVEPMQTFVALPKGRIEFVTAAAVSREGNRPVYCSLDQTESWVPSNGGIKLAATMRRNLGKTSGSSIESPNAYLPGAGSVAEDSAEYARKIGEGKVRDSGMLYDHREWPAQTDMADRESLLEGLAFVYGDSAAAAGGWVDLERVVAEVWDPATDPQDAKRFYGNAITHAADSWLSQPEWASVAAPERAVADGEAVTLGFDGSVRDDATALAICRVEDGHVELLDAWERPDGLAGKDWQVDRAAVHTAVDAAMRRFRVVGFYADPPLWQDAVDTWTNAYGARMLVRATQARPIEWWTQRSTAMVAALERFHEAVLSGEMSHDGGSVLTRHVLNARRRMRPQGLLIGKEHPHSNRKIDGAMAAVLAYEARADAVARGFGQLRQRAGRARAHGF